MNTEQWIDFSLNETESALTVFYSYMAFNEALKDEKALKSANQNIQFWMVHTASLWRTLFIYLGRLSDDGVGVKAFSGFQAHCMNNISEFSKDSFLKRRSDALILNPMFLENSEFPDADIFKKLFSLASAHNRFLRAECKTIRSKVYAHAIYTEEHEFSVLFKNVKFSEIEAALIMLWSISRQVKECYVNARTIKPELLSKTEQLLFVEKEHIYRSTLNVLLGNVK